MSVSAQRDLQNARSLVDVRDAREEDMPAVARIYAHHVLNGTASFEIDAPSRDELLQRRHSVLALGLPYIVAEGADGTILGFSYATGYRPRRAYRFTIENSVYVDAGLQRRGVGSALLSELIARCEAGPWRQMIAVIGDSANAGSIALHRAAGFRHIGTLSNVGYKFGRWLDTVLMQRSLNDGHGSPPSNEAFRT